MRVLVASDGSEDARTAVEWLGTFPVPASSEVRVLTVERLPYLTPEMLAVPRLDETVRAASWAVATQARDALAPRFATVDASVVVGDPREAIVDTADLWRADLIVVGARGLDGMKAFLLGSVSTAVVRWAPCPVLVVKGRPGPLTRALIAVDGSRDSMAAARFFTSLPVEPTTTVRLFAAVEPPALPLSAMDFPVPKIEALLDDLLRERTTTVAGMLGQLESEISARIRTLEQGVVVGRAAEAIVEAADDPRVGLVVVGARGLGPLKRLLLGSVSEQVLHRVNCPVLVVKSCPA